MLDDYKETIEYYLLKGYQIKEICEMFGDGYTLSCFYGFCKKHGLTLKEKKPCSKCDYCIRITSDRGNKQNLCLMSRRTIPATVVLPRWCELQH